MSVSESRENLIEECLETFSSVSADVIRIDLTNRALGPVEKNFLLLAERGDCPGVRRLIHEYKDNPEELDINCVDPLNRSALIAAIENENIELIKLLIDEGIQVKDALLHAVKEEYIEGVEILLNYEEEHHKPGQPYSWEAMDTAAATFTPDLTPLILAAHKNNYEILKLLLDRGASLPIPHDIRCACDDCVESIKTDSIRYSRARINSYKALTASSLISLSSRDPVLTAFELSWELRKLSRMETEFREQYNEMRSNVQLFAMSLLDYVRSSRELEYMLNYDPTGDPWEPGDHQSLERLKLAIKYKQKLFVAHPSVQQLLASIWYEGLPGFRRKGLSSQLVQVAKLGIMFPVYCTIYMLAPNSKMGLFLKKPFVKFICHSTSYAFFLMLLGAASQRIETVLFEWFAMGLGSDYVQDMVKEWKRKERGAGPGFVECGVIMYVASLVWGEMKTLWEGGILDYISDLWNIVDFITNIFYVMWLSLRMSSVYVVWREAREGRDPWYPREQWDTFDPMLLSEGAFAAGMILSFLKLVHIFSVNPHLGPLQISLGRMIIDIVKFFFIYTLVLFAFGCGLNQLLWYYAELEKNKCYHLPSGLPDYDNNDKACTIWRRYANLFEASQSLFWASFGLVDLVSFELTGIKGFTRFWALLMFGSYSVINVIVLLNMLIAMMSNSYQIISERSDSEWKFARTRLWMSYFEDGDTLPPPFNLFPTAKNILKTFGCRKVHRKSFRAKNRSREKVRENHENVMRLLVRRYITAEQSKRDAYGVTEDDITEVRQDISTLRYELIEILHQNGMKTPKLTKEDLLCSGKKEKELERRLQKDFHIGIVEGIVCDIISSMKEPTDVFSQIARVMGKRRSTKRDWNALVRRNVTQDQIGSSQEAEAMRQSRQSLRRHIVSNVKQKLTLDPEKLLEYNPKLSEVPPQARVAYAKFMTKKIEQDLKTVDEEDEQIRIKAQPPKKISVTFEGADQPSAEGTSGTHQAESEAVLDKSQEKAARVIATDDSFKALNNGGDEKRPLSPIIGSPTTMSERRDDTEKDVSKESPAESPSVTIIEKPPIIGSSTTMSDRCDDTEKDVSKASPAETSRRCSVTSSPTDRCGGIKKDVSETSPPEVPRRSSVTSGSKSPVSGSPTTTSDGHGDSDKDVSKALPTETPRRGSVTSIKKSPAPPPPQPPNASKPSSPTEDQLKISDGVTKGTLIKEECEIDVKTSEDTDLTLSKAAEEDTKVEPRLAESKTTDGEKLETREDDSLTVTSAVVYPRGVPAGKSKLSGRMRTGWL